MLPEDVKAVFEEKNQEKKGLHSTPKSKDF